MELLETEKAYLAGLIDGEGSFYIEKYMDKRTGNFSYCLRCKIGMTCLKTLTWAKDVVSKKFKCTLSAASPKKNPKWKPSWVLIINTKEVVKICRELLPYLITKKKRGELVVEYGDTQFDNRRIGRNGRFECLPEDIREKKDLIYLAIKRFNKLGEI